MSSIEIQVLIGCATGVICFIALVTAIWTASCSGEIRCYLEKRGECKVEIAKIELEKVKIQNDKKLCVSCQQAFESK
jgi:hypothetical protein